MVVVELGVGYLGNSGSVMGTLRIRGRCARASKREIMYPKQSPNNAQPTPKWGAKAVSTRDSSARANATNNRRSERKD